FRDARLVQIIQRFSQAIAVEIVCFDPLTDEQIHWFGAVELRCQIQCSPDKAQSVQHHRLHRLTDADFSTFVRYLLVNLLDKVDLLANSRYDAKMIQILCAECIVHHLSLLLESRAY